MILQFTNGFQMRQKCSQTKIEAMNDVKDFVGNLCHFEGNFNENLESCRFESKFVSHSIFMLCQKPSRVTENVCSCLQYLQTKIFSKSLWCKIFASKGFNLIQLKAP